MVRHSGPYQFLTQILIKGGKSLFNCGYGDPTYHVTENAMDKISSGSEFSSDTTDADLSYATDSQL